MSFKNDWHDVCSSLTAIKLGLSLLREEVMPQLPESKRNADVVQILDQLEARATSATEQISLLRKKFERED